MSTSGDLISFEDDEDMLLANEEEMTIVEETVDTLVESLIGDLLFDLPIEMTQQSISETEIMITTIEEDIRNTEENIPEIKENKNSAEINNLEHNEFHLERFIVEGQLEMNMFTLVETKDNFQPDFTWQINRIKHKTRQRSFEIKSEVFECTGYPFRAYAKMKVTFGSFVDMSLCLEERNEGVPIDVKLIPTVYYIIRDRTNTNSPKNMCGTNNYFFTSKFDYSLEFGSFLPLKTPLTVPPYNVDDSIAIEIYVEPPAMAQQVHSYDGTLYWAIDRYQQRKEMAREGLVFHQQSPYFCTAPNGYRVHVKMWLDEYGVYKGKGLTSSIHFLPGEFDAHLPLNFPHQTTITLFNRKGSRPNITKTLNQDTPINKCYSIDLCSDEVIENYIINDVIFCKVTIQPLN